MLFLIALSLVSTQSAPAAAAPNDPPAAEVAPEGTTSVIPKAPGSTAEKTSRPPLMREGTFLIRTLGTIGHDESIGAWTFTTVDNSKDDPRRVLGLLPSRALEDMLGTVKSRGDGVRFEVTARVLVYDGMNFILPSIGTPVNEVNTSTAKPPKSSSAEPSSAPSNSLDSSDDAVADRLESRLRDRIGSLPVSPDRPPADRKSSSLTMQEGTRLQNRRGAIVRDQRSGTWRFVFDAVGTATLDPVMEFLPCLLLERLQRSAAISDLPTSVLISGEVTSFHGRNYLLPSLWRVASGSRNIVR